MKISRLFVLFTFLAAVAQSASAQTTWPQQISSSAGGITLYQPQIDTYSGNQFTAHAAVSIAQPGDKSPTFGAIFFTANVATDRNTGIVTVQNVAVTNSNFPSAAQGTSSAVSQAITQAGANGTVTLSQTQLLAQLAITQKEQAAATDLDNTPPRILFATAPSVLVTIAGEPKLAAAPKSSILTVVNSPFFIALDPATKTYYLHGGGEWLSATNILQGPWTPATDVPDAVTAVAAAAQQPGQQAPSPSASAEPPQIIVATQPTELIQTTGPAEYGPIENTNLLYVTNTESDVFMDIDTQTLYVLLAGRWFTASSQSGPWTYVPGAQLPSDFSHIPPGLPVSNVLASVPGTQTAKNAVLDAQVPQTAAIQRTAAGPKVTYDGAPKFQPVAQGASTSYAVNTTSSVLNVEENYYACSDGVWFQAGAPTGPWIVSTTIPDVIYTIPPTCPIYPVTYCHIYSSTPDVVYCGYLPGYTGSYVFGGAVVYGTGWPYTPWFGTVFIPQPVTWGFGASFNTGWNSWGFAVGGGWGAGAFGCSWHSGWWGVSNNHWNNWNWNSNWNRNVNITNTTNVTRNVTNNSYNRSTTNNIYRNHPDRLTTQERQRLDTNQHRPANQDLHQQNEINRNRAAAQTAADDQREKNQEQENRDKAQQHIDRHQHENASHPEPAHQPAKQPRNDVYATHDGNVYRHNGSNWQQRQGGDWHEPSHENFDQNRSELNHQFAARSSGGEHGGRR